MNELNIRDRIKELRRVKAGDLHPCPWNWAEHPPEQREALLGILREVGNATAIIVRELPDGALEIIDGHLRASMDLNAIVPVLILDVTEEEAKKLLLTLNPVARLAKQNDELLTEVIDQVKDTLEDADVKKLLALIEAGVALPEDDPAANMRNARGGPEEMELRPHEHYDYVIVLARNTHEWNRLVELLDLGTVRRHGRIGAARGVRAEKLIGLLESRAVPTQEPTADE